MHFLQGFEEASSQDKCYYYNFDLPGYDLNGCADRTDTARECRELCYYTKECAQFTWIDKTFDNETSYKKCCMKKIQRTQFVHSIGAISGNKYCHKATFDGRFSYIAINFLPFELLDKQYATKFN